MNTSVSNQHICSDISEKWENTRNDIGVVWEVWNNQQDNYNRKEWVIH